MPSPAIDAAALREYLGPKGPWAVEAGKKVNRVRRAQAKLSERGLAEAAGVTTQTVRMIEAGEIVPRDYLRAAISYCLGKDLDYFWPPPTFTRVGEIGNVL